MLKKIALAGLFAITFALSSGVATAGTLSQKTVTAPTPDLFCPVCMCRA